MAPTCSIEPAFVAQKPSYQIGAYRILYVDASMFRIEEATGVVWIWAYERCTGGNPVVNTSVVGWYRITAVAPSPELLIPGLYQRVTREIPMPEPAVNPPDRGVYQLGLWLAVEDPGPITARATVGSAWAQVTATIASTTFDMGNGDEVECEGVGTPIPEDEMDVIEQGPCGYTYKMFVEDGNAITVSVTWEVVSSTSTGSSATLDPIVVTTTLDYPVDEIVTVGH